MKQLSPKALRGFRAVFYVGCATSIVLVILVGIVSYVALNRQQMLERSVEHTYLVLRKTNSINNYFNQAIASGRHLDPDLSDSAGHDPEAYQNLSRQLQTLKVLVKSDPHQLKRVSLLQQQIERLWEARGPTGSISTHSVGRLDRSLTAKINALIQAIRDAEEILLLNREKAYGTSSKQTQAIVVAGSVLILLIVSVLIYVILKEMMSRTEAYQQEHELNQLKSSFITLASHEFRTPLSSMLLSASLIEKYLVRDEKEPVIKHATKIRQVVHNLEGILEDFLSLEKLEEGQIKAACSPFDLPELCRDMISAMKPHAKPGQQLRYESHGETLPVVLDRALIEKSLDGLLFNAIKYAGDEACICLLTEVTPQEVVIRVKDNGIGIAEEDQKRLSTIFYRVHDTGHISGTGLGLHIVKRYVQLMNGTFSFSSVPNVETCFQMSFPIRYSTG